MIMLIATPRILQTKKTVSVSFAPYAVIGRLPTGRFDHLR